MPGSTRRCASGSRPSASSAIETGCRRSSSAHSSSVGTSIRLVGVEQVGLRAGRPAARRARPGAGARGVAADVGERVAHEVARGGVAAGAQPLARLGPERHPRGVRDHAVEPRHGAGAGRAEHDPLEPVAGRPPVQRARHDHEPPRRELAGLDRAQQDQRADVVAADQRPRPAHLAAEAGHHLGDPVGRVGVARAVLGVAVQRQVGQHEPEAVGELLDQRLPLAVREQGRVQQRERRAGARLAIGDPGAVVVVVEAELHACAPCCAAHPTTARSSSWPCPRSARWPPSRSTCSSTPRSSATSAPSSSRRWRSRRRR